jgi:hypothetical protein
MSPEMNVTGPSGIGVLILHGKASKEQGRGAQAVRHYRATKLPTAITIMQMGDLGYEKRDRARSYANIWALFI